MPIPDAYPGLYRFAKLLEGCGMHSMNAITFIRIGNAGQNRMVPCAKRCEAVLDCQCGKKEHQGYGVISAGKNS
jgi:hypothetical protein